MKTQSIKEDIETIQDYLYVAQQRNLVYNFDFRYFSNQIKNGDIILYGIPDGWTYKDNGSNGSINFDNDNKQCVIKKSGGSEWMRFAQALHEFPRWKQMLPGKMITAKIILTTDIPGDIKVSLYDGINSFSTTRSTKGNMEIGLQMTMDIAADRLIFSIETAVPFMTVRISGCYINIGSMALENLPCMVQGVIGERKQYIATEAPPEGELSLCNEPIELDDNYTRLNSVINQRFGTGKKGNSMLLDMRGYFSRAWNNGAKADPDANNRTKPGTGTLTGDHVSTFEGDVFLKHNHGLDFSINKPILIGDKGAATIINTSSTSKTNDSIDGKETRPKNIAELYTIKWA